MDECSTKPSHKPLTGLIEAEEERLLRNCRNGDPIAWEELVKRHTYRTYRLCYGLVRRDCDARDMTQDVFLRVFCRLSSFRPNQRSFTSWLTSLTRNIVVDHYRRNRGGGVITLERNEIESLVCPIANPDRAFVAKEETVLVQSALLKLERSLREPVILFYMEEMRLADIALRLGIAEGTVKSRLNRARTRLASHLRNADQSGRQRA